MERGGCTVGTFLGQLLRRQVGDAPTPGSRLELLPPAGIVRAVRPRARRLAGHGPLVVGHAPGLSSLHAGGGAWRADGSRTLSVHGGDPPASSAISVARGPTAHRGPCSRVPRRSALRGSRAGCRRHHQARSKRLFSSRSHRAAAKRAGPAQAELALNGQQPRVPRASKGGRS